MDIPVRDVLRREGTHYEELGLDDPEWDDHRLVELMLRRPVLINSPIVVTPLGVRLCRPSETVLNGTLEDAFRRRYPGFRPANDGAALPAAA